MTLVLFEFTCLNRHEFEAAGPSGEYGEFVVRGSGSPEPGILDAVADDIYTEVDDILRSIGAYGGKTELEQADLLQSIFGAACDPAPDGTRLEIGRRAPCPSCGTLLMASWEPVGPYTGQYFQVTHDEWRRLTQDNKENRIVDAMRQFEVTQQTPH